MTERSNKLEIGVRSTRRPRLILPGFPDPVSEPAPSPAVPDALGPNQTLRFLLAYARAGGG